MGRQKLIQLHTSGTTEPNASMLEFGEIAVQHNSEDSCLWIKDKNGNLAKFIESGAVQTMIDNSDIDCGFYYTPPYLTFEAVSANSTVKLNRVGTATTLQNAVLQYSTDNCKTWNDYTFTQQGTKGYSGDTITLSNVGDTVKFKGNNGSLGINTSNYHRFVMTGKIKASGHITSLHNEVGGDIPMSAYCYRSLFSGCTSLTDAPELPATTLANYCYSNMFQGCTSLTTAPELPATTLADYCYYGMFSGCTSLTNVQSALPATTLANSCYQNMFNRCTSLTDAPELPATTLAANCYSNMFYSCTTLTTAPELPATTLNDWCYLGMFQECTSLTNVQSALPATTLNGGCYSGMFLRCTSLTTAPELPATNLAGDCYSNMFYGCTSLTNVQSALPATTLADFCYQQMFFGCTSLTTAPELPATTLNDSCYLGMFQECTSLTNVQSALPATTLANYCYEFMFRNCTSLTTVPELPATTLNDSCYLGMFHYCTSLTNVQSALPATTLADSCYKYMFNGCTSLTNVQSALPATTLANYCYQYMFVGCTSLTDAPELPATTLAEGCYSGMFARCTSLTTAPELPATNLAYDCYSEMFYKCSNLNLIAAMFTTTPSSSYTYNWVNGVALKGTFIKKEYAPWNVIGFNGVPNGWIIGEKQYLTFEAVSANSTVQLNRIGTDTTLQNAVLQYSIDNGETWNDYSLESSITLSNVGNTVKFKGINGSFGYNYANYHQFVMTGKIKAIGDITSLNNGIGYDIPMSAYCYYSMFSGCTSLITSPELPTTTLASDCYSNMFYGCSNLNYIKAMFTTEPTTAYTNNWVNGVASAGTFVKGPKATWDVTGVNGVPTGWIIDRTQIPYLTFEAVSANSTVKLNRIGSASTLQNAILQYSIDNGQTWNNYSFTKQGTKGYSGYTITLQNVGDTVKFKGNNGSLGISTSNYHRFVMTGKIKASGDITSLNNGIGYDIPMSAYCYYNMFTGCTSLITSPELPSTTLADYCYQQMFFGCTSLTIAPNLPATTLALYCYSKMFQRCISLVTPPILPSTNLSNACYIAMFSQCTSLTTSPELPATTLVSNCYSEMFSGCSNLNYIKAMFTTAPSTTYTRNWVTGVSQTGIFVKNISAQWSVTGVIGVPKGWQIRMEPY